MEGEHPELNSTAASLVGFLETYCHMSGHDLQPERLAQGCMPLRR